MVVDAGDKQPRAANNCARDIMEWDSDVVYEEIKHRVEIKMGIGGEELRVHVEDATERGAREAHGAETVFDRF